MTTVGEILRKRREEKKLTIAQVEATTKIRGKFVDALEKNDFNKLPPGTFTKGFIKNYAAFLGLPQNEMLAFYRRQVNEEKTLVLPHGKTEALMNNFALTPQKFMAGAVVALLLAFFAYLIFSYFQFAGSPVLIVSAPGNNIVTTSEMVDVDGKTDPDATITINNQPVTVNENGSFTAKIDLQPGLNSLNIVASNKYKRTTTVVRNLRLEQ